MKCAPTLRAGLSRLDISQSPLLLAKEAIHLLSPACLCTNLLIVIMAEQPNLDQENGRKRSVMHVENSGIPTSVDKIHNGDRALALFDNLDDIHEGFEPGEEKKLVRKIDLIILPFLSVCYAFYYVSTKTR